MGKGTDDVVDSRSFRSSTPSVGSETSSSARTLVGMFAGPGETQLFTWSPYGASHLLTWTGDPDWTVREVSTPPLDFGVEVWTFGSVVGDFDGDDADEVTFVYSGSGC